MAGFTKEQKQELAEIIDGLVQKMEEGFSVVGEHLVQIDGRLDRLEDRVGRLEQRFDAMEYRTDKAEQAVTYHRLGPVAKT